VQKYDAPVKKQGAGFKMKEKICGSTFVWPYRPTTCQLNAYFDNFTE
jgi:hypothetical protein